MNIKLPFIALAIFVFAQTAPAQEGAATSLNNTPWKLAPQLDTTQRHLPAPVNSEHPDVQETGEQLSVPGYAADKWIPAHVPGTALVDYVLAGLEPEPNFGDNAYTLFKIYHRHPIA